MVVVVVAGVVIKTGLKIDHHYRLLSFHPVGDI